VNDRDVPLYQPMRLRRVAQPFDDPDFIWEWKIDGFGGLAFIENRRCLVSRRSNVYALMFRRRAPFFCTFDLLMLDGEDVRGLPLLERKRRLLDVRPRIESRLRTWITFTKPVSDSLSWRASTILKASSESLAVASTRPMRRRRAGSR
jgi:hypothetical protein